MRVDAACVMEVANALVAVAEGFANAWSLDDDSAFSVGLAVREAVVNAIRHAGGGSPHRFAVSFGVSGERIVVTVSDDGPGFRPERVPDPCEPGNLSKGSGRGLLYMRKLMDEVEFTFPRGGGTTVRMSRMRTK